MTFADEHVPERTKVAKKTQKLPNRAGLSFAHLEIYVTCRGCPMFSFVIIVRKKPKSVFEKLPTNKLAYAIYMILKLAVETLGLVHGISYCEFALIRSSNNTFTEDKNSYSNC